MRPPFRLDPQSLRLPAEVLAEILALCPPLVGEEELPLLDADGRVLAREFRVPGDLPARDTAVMDGWLLADRPARDGSYQVTGTCLAGALPAESSPAPGEALRVMTGTALAEGAWAVLRAEDGVEDENGRLQLRPGMEIPPRGTNIRRRGAELRGGTVAIAAGTLLRPPHLGLAACLGATHLVVRPRPAVILLSSGDELIDRIPGPDGEPPGSIPAPAGKIYNASAPLILAWLRREGTKALYGGTIPDNEEATRVSLGSAVARADLVITTGGVSAGVVDCLDEVLAHLGKPHRRYRLRIRPGKSFSFALIGGVPVFALPGNPVSSALSCLRFVRPALYAMQGATIPPEDFLLPLAGPVPRDPVFTLQHRACREPGPDGPRVHPLLDQDSSMLSGLAAADLLVDIPAGSGPLAEGDPVVCHKLPW